MWYAHYCKSLISNFGNLFEPTRFACIGHVHSQLVRDFHVGN